MKNLLFLVLIFLTFVKTLNAQWEQCNNDLGSPAIYSFIVDSNRTYTGTDNGVFMTTDNGDSWTTKNNGLKSSTVLVVESLTINGNNIYAGTWSDGIFLSTDKGENWVRKSNGLPYIIDGYDTLFMVFINSILINNNNIFIGTNNGIYLSNDNGTNWIARNNGLVQFDTLHRDVNSMVVNENHIFAGTRYGVFMTSNNGDNWFPKNNGIDNLVVLSLVINGKNIYAGTEYGGIFLSTDNGDDWKYIGRKNTIIAAIIINGNYIITSGPGVYLSTDNGNNWTEKNSGLENLGTKPIIINDDYIFAGTNEGGIFRAKLSDLGITDVKENEQKNEGIIYPNPASDVFRLKFSAPFAAIVQINIFDLLGNKVLSQTEQCSEGTNEKQINCEMLPSGWYYVKININGIIKTMPLVIVK